MFKIIFRNLCVREITTLNKHFEINFTFARVTIVPYQNNFNSVCYFYNEFGTLKLRCAFKIPSRLKKRPARSKNVTLEHKYLKLPEVLDKSVFSPTQIIFAIRTIVG